MVIPVYGQWDLVKRNIDSLLKFDPDSIREIIAVDDCSPQPCPYRFDATIVRIIKNETNLGYTGTVNNGLKHAVSDIIILLDSDAFLLEPVINDIIKTFEKDDSLGCLGFSTVSEKGVKTGSNQYEPSVFGYIVGQQIEAKICKLLVNSNALILPYSCSVSFRKECLSELGYFDEKTFPVLEADNDLSLRIHQSRWTLKVREDIVVCHEGGNSYKVNSKRVILLHEAKWKLFRKHKKIKHPVFVKLFLELRIRVELIIMAMLKGSISKLSTNDKISGRRKLLKEVMKYN